MLATVLFSIHRIVFASTVVNSRVLAINILTLTYSDKTSSQISDGQIRLVAFVIQSIICLLLYFDRRTSFVSNIPFAAFKVLSLLLLAGAGLVRRGSQWDMKPPSGAKAPEHTSLNAINALTHVIFSYQGFENVNCVSVFIGCEYTELIRTGGR